MAAGNGDQGARVDGDEQANTGSPVTADTGERLAGAGRARRSMRFAHMATLGVAIVAGSLALAQPLAGTRTVGDRIAYGSGPDYCRDQGGVRAGEHRKARGWTSGASFQGVYACEGNDRDVSFNTARDFECTELAHRFMKVRYGRDVLGVRTGAAFVQIGVRQHERSGRPAVGVLPNPGDIVSFAAHPSDPSGHVAVIIGVSVNQAGDGAITVMEQNWAAYGGWDFGDGPGGNGNGTNTIRVRDWHWSMAFWKSNSDFSWLKLAPAESPDHTRDGREMHGMTASARRMALPDDEPTLTLNDWTTKTMAPRPTRSRPELFGGQR